MSETDPLTQILIHVGESRKGIKNLEQGQRDLEGGLSDVNAHLSRLNGSAVRQTECAALRDGIRDALDQTIAENAEQHAKILSDMTPVATPKGLKYWVGVAVGVATVLGFLGSLLWGVVTVGQKMERFKIAAETDKKRQANMAEALKKLSAQKTKIIYVKQQPVKLPPKRKAPYRSRRSIP